MTTSRLNIVLALAIVVLLTGARASAQPDLDASPAGDSTSSSSSSSDVLRALDSDRYETRQRQTQRLLADASLSIDDIAALMTRAESAEQRHRLLAVGRHHVLRQRREQLFNRPDRGSLGISHRTLTPDDLPGEREGAAVEIVLTLPGFPAHAQLEAGDRVVAVEGRSLPGDFTAEHFREMIINYRSGDTLDVTIERRGERLERTIELASAQALGAMYDPGRLELRTQFEADWLRARETLMAARRDDKSADDDARAEISPDDAESNTP